MKLNQNEAKTAKAIMKILEPYSNDTALTILNKVLMLEINKERERHHHEPQRRP